jgi:predicted nucleic acid-binding protein
MARLVFLDSGPLGYLANAPGRPTADRCRRWAKDLAAAGTRVIVPEIADYEVRRKLLHIGAVASVARLDQVKATLTYLPLTTAAMLRAADLWAAGRRAGRPTAPDPALDADAILAAQALTAVGPADVAVVATTNVGHLSLFVAAETWDQIAP